MNRFYSLFENLKGFGVVLQSTIPNGEPIEKYLTRPISEVAVNTEKGQIFHPAEEIIGKVIFTPITANTNGERRKLVFFSKHWTACGRFGEDVPFGFEKCRPGVAGYRGYDYLPLAYPGVTGKFTPLYVKIMLRDTTTPFCVKISAEEENGKIIVTAEKVFFNQLPPCLKRI